MELNYFNCDIIDSLINKRFNSIKADIKDTMLFKLKYNNIIMHKSTKKANTIQLSYFDNRDNTALSDKELNMNSTDFKEFIFYNWHKRSNETI